MMEKKFKHILLVDDEPICNYISIKWIERMEVSEKIYVLNNGNQALEFLKKFDEVAENERPNLILLDIKMPIMDGFEFLQEFNKSCLKCKDNIKIVLLTSSKKATDISDASKFNVDGYLEKPLNREKIEYLLDNMLE